MHRYRLQHMQDRIPSDTINNVILSLTQSNLYGNSIIDFEVEPPYFKVSDTHYAATWLLHPDAPQVEMPKIVSERIKNALKGKGGNDNE